MPIDGNDLYSLEGPVCPWCKHLHEIDYHTEAYCDESLTEVLCHECERLFDVRTYHRGYSWDTTNQAHAELEAAKLEHEADLIEADQAAHRDVEDEIVGANQPDN